MGVTRTMLTKLFITTSRSTIRQNSLRFRISHPSYRPSPFSVLQSGRFPAPFPCPTCSNGNLCPPVHVHTKTQLQRWCILFHFSHTCSDSESPNPIRCLN